MINSQLNPKIFNDGCMIPEVRESLLEIADEFLETLVGDSGISFEPLDIILVGSNASFNYSSSSDIDLHIVVNFDMIDGEPDALIQAYCNAEKSNFNSKYDFKVKGSSVEVYVEDVRSLTMSAGIYSVLNGVWIKYPDISDDFDDSYDVEFYNGVYNDVQSALVSGDSDRVKSMINQLYLLRRDGLALDGEFSDANLIFKEIRNLGLIDQLKDEYYRLVSKEISVENLKESKDEEDLVADYSKVPDYLYHATLVDNLGSIQDFGLGADITKDSSMYDDLYQGEGFFLSDDPQDAAMYLSDYDPDDVVVLQVPKRVLKKNLLYYDTNNEDNIENPRSWYYSGVISNPINKLKIVEGVV